MLGDILISTQLLVTHLVTTFFVNDNHDILGIYLILFQPEFVMTMSVTFSRIDHGTKKSHDLVTDQAMVANMS